MSKQNITKVEQELSPYLQRLKVLKEHGLLSGLTNNAKSRSANFRPKIVFLDTPQGVAEVGDAIYQGWPVVTDYGSTYGTAFAPHLREAVAEARGEIAPLAVVSLVTFKDIALRWVDTSRLHPKILCALNEGKFDILEGISFIRFPCTEACRDRLGPNYVNEKQEVQVFIVPDEDPLMSYLRKDHNIDYIAVRSSNVTGQQEQAFVNGATRYAQQIGSPILAVSSLESFSAQIEDEPLAKQNRFEEMRRRRHGSQPIVALPTVDEEPVITLVRAGNTDPSTLQRLLSGVVSTEIGFVYVPEKITPFTRPAYSVDESVNDPQQIREQLLKHTIIN